MAESESRHKAIYDEFGVIREAAKILPDNELKLSFLSALAELEDNQCYVDRSFPVTRLHKVVGVKQAVYRADVTKISGWRMHVQMINGAIHLKDIIPGAQHDNAADVIKSKKVRYE